MAFEVPSHLPRAGNPVDISSNILSKVDEATAGTLTASLASSWLADLDETISSTKVIVAVTFGIRMTYQIV